MENKRILAGVIDFLITAVLQCILMFLVVIISLLLGSADKRSLIISSIWVTMISMFYLILRDMFGNGSIGKRIMKLKIIGSDSGTATLFARLLRNITWIMGHVEILLILFSQKRDRLAHTDVVSE